MRRVIPATLLALALSALLVLVPAPGRATAVDVPPVPAPVNILPSVVRAGTTADSAIARAYMVGKFALAVGQEAAIQAKLAGIATATQAAQVASAAAKFSIPAVSPKILLKGAGAVGIAMTGWEIGTSLGTGVSRVVGFKDEQVCQEVDGGVIRAWAGVLNGVDCAVFDNAIAEAQQNLDAGLGWSGRYCMPGSTMCVTLRQSVKDPYYACVDVDNFDPAGANLFGTYGGNVQNVSITLGGWQSSDAASSSWCVPGASTFVPNFNYSNAYETFWIGGSQAGPVSGTPGEVHEADADPERYWRCEITGSTGTVYAADSATFHESDDVVAPVDCPAIPEGDWGVHQTILEMGGPEPLVVSSEDTTPEYQEHAETYPECTTGLCILSLRPVGSNLTCHQSPEACADWFSDPDKAGNYECRYGTHVVDLAECYLYAPTFKPGASVTGDAYADPETGLGTGVQTGPSSDSGTFSQPVKDPSTERKCFPQGWAVLNPVEWVTKPVQCALEWAFVPRASVVNSLRSGLQVKANNTIMTGANTFIGAMQDAFNVGASGCLGPAWHLEISFPWAGGGGLDEVYYPLNSCEAPMSNFASFFNLLTQGFIGIAAVMAGIRYMASIVGFAALGARTSGGDNGDNGKVRFK